VRGSTDEGAAVGLIAVVTRDCRPADTNRWAGRRRDARDNIPGLLQPARRISTLGSCRRPAVARVDRAVVGRGSSLHCPCSTMRGGHHPGTRYTCQLCAAQPATCRRNCTHALRDDMEKNFDVWSALAGETEKCTVDFNCCYAFIVLVSALTHIYSYLLYRCVVYLIFFFSVETAFCQLLVNGCPNGKQVFVNHGC